MKKAFYFALVIGALLFSVVLAVYGSDPRPTPDNGNRMNTSPTRIRLGNPKDSDLNGPGASVDNHPTGISFYQRNWRRGNLGTVELVHGRHNFVVDNALSVLDSAIKTSRKESINGNISFGVSPEQADTHEAALARVMRLLADLRARGWARYIGTNHPRLTGKQRMEL